MITVYTKPGCPFCAKVLEVVEELGISIQEKSIVDATVRNELNEVGGKPQVPFLDDDNMTPYLIDDDVEMYESDAIVAYLRNKFGGTSVRKPTVHVSTNTSICPSDS